MPSKYIVRDRNKFYYVDDNISVANLPLKTSVDHMPLPNPSFTDMEYYF